LQCDETGPQAPLAIGHTDTGVFSQSGTQAERLAVFNAVRGVERAQQYYSFPKKESEDVHFDLVEIDKISFGQDFSVTVHIHVSFVISELCLPGLVHLELLLNSLQSLH
jgi:hypothetical protein